MGLMIKDEHPPHKARKKTTTNNKQQTTTNNNKQNNFFLFRTQKGKRKREQGKRRNGDEFEGPFCPFRLHGICEYFLKNVTELLCPSPRKKSIHFLCETHTNPIFNLSSFIWVSHTNNFGPFFGRVTPYE